MAFRARNWRAASNPRPAFPPMIRIVFPDRSVDGGVGGMKGAIGGYYGD